MSENNNVNEYRPEYYGGENNPYEVVKVIRAWKLGFELGNVLKYICRAGYKDRSVIKDLKKAQTYLGMYIKYLEPTGDPDPNQPLMTKDEIKDALNKTVSIPLSPKGEYALAVAITKSGGDVRPLNNFSMKLSVDNDLRMWLVPVDGKGTAIHMDLDTDDASVYKDGKWLLVYKNSGPGHPAYAHVTGPWPNNLVNYAEALAIAKNGGEVSPATNRYIRLVVNTDDREELLKSLDTNKIAPLAAYPEYKSDAWVVVSRGNG